MHRTNWLLLGYRAKGQNPLHQFPRSKSIYNKLAQPKVHCFCCVVSFPKFRCSDLLITCCGLVGDILTRQDSLPRR